MNWLVRFLMRRFGVFFLTAAVLIFKTEREKMAQDTCTHEGQTTAFCGLCGKQIADPDVEGFAKKMENVFENVLKKHGLIKEPKANGEKDKPKTLRDKLYGKKEEKK